eukprot:4151194-Pleurochrysis_carterae.AAC.3
MTKFGKLWELLASLEAALEVGHNHEFAPRQSFGISKDAEVDEIESASLRERWSLVSSFASRLIEGFGAIIGRRTPVRLHDKHLLGIRLQVNAHEAAH